MKEVAVKYITGFAVALALLVGCSEQAPPTDADFQKRLLEQLITATSGDVIEIPAGNYRLNRALSLKVDGVTLRGAGMDKTVLSFKGQAQGAEGLLVNASNFTIEDLAIEDTKGDALKVNGGDNIVIRRVRTEWTGGPQTENGAYGIYPVKCSNVLVEESVAIGASDAGIYVGQSNNIIVRRNRVEFNVAGIEIENSTNADVYENTATNNTGGILVFNMPDLPSPGHSTRMFDNRIHGNNTSNFAARGTAVAGVPTGTGVMVTSNDRVEIFNNRIADNQTANIIIASFESADYLHDLDKTKVAADYDPYPEKIFIYGNAFSGGGDSPDGLDLKALKLAMYGLGGSFPDILWDGVADPQHSDGGAIRPEFAICVDNGDAGVINVDLANGSENVSTDMSQHQCTHPKLPAINLALAS